MCIKINGFKRPTTKARHNWESRAEGNNSIFRLPCKGMYHNIKIKGVNITKTTVDQVMTHARLMRQTGDKFFLLVDKEVHGVNPLSRLIGGYYFYVIEMDGGEWCIKRHFYSKFKLRKLKLDGLQFYNKFWRVFNSCYYGMATEENVGGDNSG
jgi:hypothetical protein